ISFDGQVLCQRMVVAPCACTTVGAATAAAVVTAAPVRNLRREVLRPWLAFISVMASSRYKLQGLAASLRAANDVPGRNFKGWARKTSKWTGGCDTTSGARARPYWAPPLS